MFLCVNPWLLSLCLGASVVIPVLSSGCDRSPRGEGSGQQEVILYTSADPDVLRLVTAAFEKKTGIKVKAVGDTEATKTTGLVQRLIAERERARADVWWSSEAAGTIQLSKAGVLEAYTSEAAEQAWPRTGGDGTGGWPAAMRGKKKDWYGFARRTRVLVYNTARLKEEEVPTRLAGLGEARFKGRLGMARPEFGTTRGQMGALLYAHGERVLGDWLAALKANDVRLYDGNSAVVRAVGTGEIWVGLTDNDDVEGGKRNGWPVAMVPIGNHLLAVTHDRAGSGTVSHFPEGALQTPCTVAVVKGAPHGESARRLVDFLLSGEVEAMLAASEWKTNPVSPRAFDPPLDVIEDGRYVPIMDLDLEAAAEKAGEAVGMCEKILGR